MSEASVRVLVREWVGPLGALQPDDAARLAAHLIRTQNLADTIVLDFRDAGAVTSSFANELFVSLAQIRPLDDWRNVLQFSGLGATQAQVITRSLRAAIKLDPKA
jgi:hypothetical protein